MGKIGGWTKKSYAHWVKDIPSFGKGGTLYSQVHVRGWDVYVADALPYNATNTMLFKESYRIHHATSHERAKKFAVNFMREHP